jgi:hypothetical protein
MVGLLLIWGFAKKYCGWKIWWVKTGAKQLRAFARE